MVESIEREAGPGGLLDRLVSSLEPVEVNALERYGEGWSREEIAAQLGVGPRLVNQSLAQARRKLGARSHKHAAWMLRVQRLQGPLAAPSEAV